MKNSTAFFGIIVLILLMGMFVFAGGGKGITGNVIKEDGEIIQGDFQKAVLTQEGFNYKDLEVRAGQPIELSADSSVQGCLRAVVFDINGKKYSKYLQSEKDTLELPALKKGTYRFACTMGMGFGKLIVK